MSVSTPVIVCSFNQPERVKQLLKRIVQEPVTCVFVYCDGARNANDEELCATTQQIAQDFSKQSPVSVIVREQHFGPSKNLTCAVSETLTDYRQVMVFEDHILPRAGCLGFLERALESYRMRQEIFSIGCYHKPLPALTLPKTFLSPRFISWGWATWRDRWKSVQKEILSGALPWNEYYNIPNSAGQDIPNQLRDSHLQGQKLPWDTLTAMWCLKQQWYQVQPGEAAIDPQHSDSSEPPGCSVSPFDGELYQNLDSEIEPLPALINALKHSYEDPNKGLFTRLRERVAYQMRRVSR